MERGLEIDGVKLLLTGKSKEADVLSSELGIDMVPMVSNGDFSSYRVPKPKKVEGKLFSMNLMFKKGLLERISLVPAFGASSWQDISDESLQNMHRSNEQWLEEHFGSSLPWAKVEPELDKKAGIAQVVITME
ncbi:MAG: hypothetical protein V2I43_05610 [Parvularcula sp.]|jgi:hypothetical protein|nr:hypothetical protein [Parvularcula sp.]